MSENLEDELRLLEVKLKQLKLDYEAYFAGIRPREPSQTRSEVQKAIIIQQQTPIRNTALRFKFNSINSRFQAWKRQWDSINREIDAGTYKRHRFKADLKDRQRDHAKQSAALRAEAAGAAPNSGGGDGLEKLLQSYRKAAQSCGQDAAAMSRQKLETVIRKQEAALRKQLGCERVSFRVVVQDGRVKLKAKPARA